MKSLFIIAIAFLFLAPYLDTVYAGHCISTGDPPHWSCIPQASYCEPSTKTVFRNRSGEFPFNTPQEQLHINTGEPCDPATYGKSKEGIDSIFGRVEPPKAVENIGFGAFGISNVLNNIITLIFVISGIVFVFMILVSAFQWIISGGDKEKLAAARGRLINAIIGIALLALAFLIIGVVGQITGFKFFVGQGSKSPEQPASPVHQPADDPFK